MINAGDNIIKYREGRNSTGQVLEYVIREYPGTAKPYGVKRPGTNERRYKTFRAALAAFNA